MVKGKADLHEQNLNKHNTGFTEQTLRYKTLTDYFGNVKWVLDLDTMKFIYITPAVQLLRGFTPDEVLKQDAKDSFKSTSNIFLSEVLPKRIASFLESKKTVVYTDEFEQLCKNGSKIWVEVNSYFSLNPLSKKVEMVGISRNIDARKKAEQTALQEQQHREEFIKNAPLAIVEWDMQQKILAWNPEAENIFGFSEKEVLGKNFFEVLVPDNDKGKVEKVVYNLITKRNKNSHKNFNTTKSGKTLVCLWFNTPVFNQLGELVSVISMGRDITQIEQAKLEKESANKNYQQLINEMQEGVGIVDLKENFIFVNQAFEKMIGYKSEELLGKNLNGFMPTANYKEIIAETQKRIKGHSSNYTTQLITKGGHTKVVSISASPWRNEKGEIVGTMALIMDITNQIIANEELKRRYDFEKRIFNISSRFADNSNFNNKVNKSLADIGTLCNASRVFIVKFDHKKQNCAYPFIWENPDKKNSQSLNSCDLTVFNWLINKLSNVEHLFIKNIDALKTEANRLWQYFFKNGIDNLMVYPIYLGENLYGLLGIQNILNENTWSKNEFILFRSAGEILCNSIQRKLNEDQIKKLNIQLSEKNKEIEQVLYVTSHDIRSPLVNIIGFTTELNKSVDELSEYLNKEIISADDKKNINYILQEDIPEVVKFINAGGVKIDKLLNSLLRLSRLGRTPLEPALINTENVVREIVDSLEYQIQNQKINIEIAELPEIVTDKNLFTQIIGNLIDNAIKYYDESKKCYVKISAKSIDDEYIFIVEDNGIGIQADKKEKVFEIFNRLNPDKVDGEGIGLTMIKKALEKLKGQITIESEYGKGSKFIVGLPKN